MCSVRKGFFKNFANFRGKHLCWSLFLIKLQAFNPAYLTPTLVFFHLYWSTSANDFFCISEIQTTNNVIYILAENFIFNFRIFCKIFSYLLSFPNFSSTECVFVFAFFSHTISNIPHNISNVSFSRSLNRLNALSVIIKNMYTSAMRITWVQDLFRDRDKHCTTASLIKVSPLKVGVYLILEVHYTLFTDST